MCVLLRKKTQKHVPVCTNLNTFNPPSTIETHLIISCVTIFHSTLLKFSSFLPVLLIQIYMVLSSFYFFALDKVTPNTTFVYIYMYFNHIKMNVSMHLHLSYVVLVNIITNVVIIPLHSFHLHDI